VDPYQARQAEVTRRGEWPPRVAPGAGLNELEPTRPAPGPLRIPAAC